MKLELDLDLNNPQHVLGMQAFFTALSTGVLVATLPENTQKTLDLAEATTDEVKPVKLKRTRKPKAEEAPKEEAPKEEAPKEEAPKEEAPKEEVTATDSAEVITLEMLREVQAPLVSANKDAIKSKLQSFNAPNLTKLDKKHYAAWMAYLKTFN